MCERFIIQKICLIIFPIFQAKNLNGRQLFDALNAQFEPIASIIRSEELYEGTLYTVSAIRGVHTKYGPKVVVDLPKYGTLFLPNRYVKRFLNEGSDPRRLNISCSNTVLKLVGREDDKYKTPIFEFISVNEEEEEDNPAAVDDTSLQPKKKRVTNASSSVNGKQA